MKRGKEPAHLLGLVPAVALVTVASIVPGPVHQHPLVLASAVVTSHHVGSLVMPNKLIMHDSQSNNTSKSYQAMYTMKATLREVSYHKKHLQKSKEKHGIQFFFCSFY